MRALLILALIFMTSAKISSAKTYLVCVGISDYPGERDDLMNCVHDAEMIKWLFEKNCKAEVVIIKNEEATTTNICSKMKDLYSKAKKNDTVIMYYSGHGYTGCLECYDGQLSYPTLWNKFNESAAKYRIALINACYSGTIRQKYDNSKLSGKNVMFFSSSRSGEVSLENPFMKNGYFTTYLLQGLRGSADVNKDRTITAKELFDYVSKKVKESTEDKQHPTMWGRFSDDMPVMKW